MTLFKMMIYKIIFVFKFFEPVFWFAQVWLILNLINPRKAFESHLKVINWLIRAQGFETPLLFADKAFNNWRRDFWILFFLNPLIIILIHLI